MISHKKFNTSHFNAVVPNRIFLIPSLLVGVTLQFLVSGGGASAADVGISDSPMASSTSTEIKPNVMFVLDDSGSMGWSHLPDHVKSFAGAKAEDLRVGYVSSHCNGIYYNPATTYEPPVKADGTSFPNASFGAARVNGFDSSSTTVDLGSKFRAYDNASSDGVGSDAEQSAYYYKYIGTKNTVPLSYLYKTDGSVNKDLGKGKATTFYGECVAAIGSDVAKEAFQKVTISSGGSEAQNFANWYSYYRIRIYAMKSAAGFAFKNIPNPDNFRVGYSTHSYTGVDSKNSAFLKIANYCTAADGVDLCAQRSAFYEKLYAATPSGGTPLRPAVSKIGRMYAGKLLTGADDPIQYSCQQNFLILSTDGYWNGDGPVDIGGSAGVGDVDGGALEPMKDKLKKANTLADTTFYYYDIDLRSSALGNCTGAEGDGVDVCEDNVPPSGNDNNNRQHMTTFTLGLGVDGSLKFTEDYLAGGSTDFNQILDGSLSWPDPTDNEDLHRIDDLWHAAVNGRGVYYSAKTPQALAQGISRALSGVSAMSGSGAASATSNLEPVAGDNFAYVASYRTVKWDGDVQAREINLTTGALSAEDDRIWSAKEKLNAISAASRKIYFKSGTALAEFTTTNLTDAKTKGWFQPCSAGALGDLTQCATAGFAATATQDVIINYIRGDDSLEDQEGNDKRLLRDREGKLGDIVSSQPVYVKKAPFGYTDVGYAKFAEGKEDRQGAVIVGANDGMLHAFNAETGVEMWAYVPTPVMPNLYRLADSNYGDNHRYYVDGSLAVGDICAVAACAEKTGAGWKTILVGGLGKGGKGYFALDITDTTAPKFLWEFTAKDDNDLGYTFGNPIITKVAGKWVVVFASGYNNGDGESKGQGRVFMLDAVTGAKLAEVVTNTDANPAKSGIAKLSNWVDNATYENSTQYVYGGDLAGSLWRVDLESKAASRLALLGGSGGAQQSITTKPELALVKVGGTLQRVVFVGTGRYLGLTDLTDMSVQSLYAIKEDLSTDWGSFRDATGVVKQTLTASGINRMIEDAEKVAWSDAAGWFVDFDVVEGERINTDMFLDRGVLAVVTNVPEADACNVGGYSYIYFFDFKTGSYVTTVEGEVVGYRLANAMGVGMSVIRVNGKSVAIVTTSDNKHIAVPVPEYSGSGTMKRMLWRELFVQ